MQYSYIYVSFLLVLSCTTSQDVKTSLNNKNNVAQEDLDDETQDRLLKIAKEEMFKEGLDLEKLTHKINQDSLNYHVYFNPMDSLTLGGGGIITISKQDFRIIDKKFHQ